MFIFEYWVQIALLICYITDVVMTYVNIKRYQILRPDLQFKDYELNPLLCYIWNKFGLKKGYILSILITFCLWIFLMIVTIFYPNMGYYYLGMYTIVLSIHFKIYGEVNL